jgi:hypothetical protein
MPVNLEEWVDAAQSRIGSAIGCADEKGGVMNTMLHGLAMLNIGQAVVYFVVATGGFDGDGGHPWRGVIYCCTVAAVLWGVMIWLSASATADSPKGVNND